MFLYLARRDRVGVKILASFMGEPKTARVDDLKLLNLPDSVVEALQQEIYDNRMMWEPWIEPGESYHKLKVALYSRGFKNLPMTSRPSVPYVTGLEATTKSISSVSRTMVQKKGS